MATLFETDRFIIREYTPSDENDFIDLLTDPEVKVYLPQRSREEWAAIFDANLEFYKNNPGLGRWGVEDKATGKLVANAMLLPGREGLQGHEVGYSLEKFLWGRGAGTEITRGVVKYAFDEKGIKSLYAVTVPENIGSRRVLEKAGFSDKGLKDLLGMQLSFYQLTI